MARISNHKDSWSLIVISNNIISCKLTKRSLKLNIFQGGVGTSIDTGSTFNVDRAQHFGLELAKVSYILFGCGILNVIGRIITGKFADFIGNGIFWFTTVIMSLYSVFFATSDFCQEEIGQTLWFITFTLAHAAYHTTTLVMIR